MVLAYYLFTLALTLMSYIIIRWGINDFERMRVFVQQYYENRPFFSNTA